MSQAPTPEVFEERAESVSRSLPALLLDAERIANTVALGAHGRRRSGMGETFWQYRRFRDGDAPTAIDWLLPMNTPASRFVTAVLAAAPIAVLVWAAVGQIVQQMPRTLPPDNP